MSVVGSEPPTRVGGRYVVGDLIGRGGAADVYRARDELLGRDVAIKMFAGGDSTTAEAHAEDEAEAGQGDGENLAGTQEAEETRHRREVLTLAGLSHPGLVTVYDVGDEAGRSYFVMQLIEGDTLARRIRAGSLTVTDVVALGAALADALAYVHRRGVVHRDVKPGNVLLDPDGRAHLSDFGIAAVHDAAPVTAAGMVIGTASYLSPEQVRGEPVGAAVDVYALGLVLLECLTGRREYPGNALEAAVARLHRRPEIPVDLPPSLGTLLSAMTDDDPSRRPSAEEVVASLRSISREVGMEAETVLSPVLMSAPTATVAGADGTAGAGTVAPAPARPAPPRHRRLLAGAVAAGTALLVAGSAVAAYTVLGNETPTAPAPQITLPPPAPPIPTTTPELRTRDDEPEQATATRRAPSTSSRSTPSRTRSSEPTSRVAPAPVTTRPTVSPPAASTGRSTPRSSTSPTSDSEEAPPRIGPLTQASG